MKYKFSYVVVCLLMTVSCSSDQPMDIDDAKVNTNEISIEEKQSLSSNYNFDTDWETIKTAILANDLVTLQSYVNEDNVDPLLLLNACKEEYIQDKMKLISYPDLEVDFIEDEVYLVFFASGSGTFTMYLYQGEKSLYVDYFIVGG
jgi:hypothetical protein